MEVRENFSPFKSGDVVRVKKDFLYVNRDLLFGETYIIDKMLSVAGVVTLIGQEPGKTFPEGAFELLYGVNDGEETKD
jgi:hypothetical protein